MTRRLGLRGRLFFASIAIVGALGVPTGLYLEFEMRAWLEERITSELRHGAQVSAEAVRGRRGELGELAHRLGTATESRITIIDSNGRVLGDSGLSRVQRQDLGDFSQRPEVRAAQSTGLGTARRESQALGVQMLYVATRAQVADGTGTIRAAVKVTHVDMMVVRLRVLLLGAALLGLLIALLMTWWASSLASRPVRALVDRARPLLQGEATPDLEAAQLDTKRHPDSVSEMASELAKTVAALARERDRFGTVLEGMSDAVIAVDKQQRISLANPAAKALLKLPAHSLHQPLSTVMAPELEGLAIKGGQEAAAAEFSYGDRQLQAQATPLASAKGSVIVMHDVSEMRRLETIRKDFVANVSHELRTPVSIIRANAETLLDGGLQDPERRHGFVDAIHRHSVRLGNLIADLLDLSRIESGRYKLTFRNLNCSEVALRSVEVVGGKAPGRTINVTIDESLALVVRADQKATDQVLTNLLDNAVKYSQDDRPVQLGIYADGDCVRFEITDTGPGIEAEQRERVFERFYRVDPGRSRDMGGTGLGLAIVKHLTESMDGSVGVKANEPSGSIFWFTLPRAALHK